jgi:O-antigen ligase
MGACFGLTLRYSQASKDGGFFHGPAMVGLVAALLICISVPLSGARACTVLLGILTVLALAKGTPMVSRSLRMSGVSRAAANAAMIVAAALALWGGWTIAGDVIRARISKAKELVAVAWAQGGLGTRSMVYHDTWRMAQARPLFGWGMGSFPTVFALYNTQEPIGDRIPVVYHDAHSDWIQSVAEIGFAGTALIGGAVVLPLLAVRRLRASLIPNFIFSGCALVAAYAWVEFPFGNVAVVLAWWLCFFGSVQYIRLTGPPEARPAT